MFSLDFTCSGKGKPLFGTGISLHLRHFPIYLIYYTYISIPLQDDSILYLFPAFPVSLVQKVA